MSETVTKRPADRLDYDVLYGDHWLDEGDAIASALWAIESDREPSTLTVDQIAWTATTVKLWVRGGADGETATIIVTATTAAGRVKEIAFRMRIRDDCR